MKGTRIVTVRVRRDDLDEAITLTDGGLTARENHDWDGSIDPGLAVAEYSVWYGPETDDASHAEQAIAQVHANLDSAGLWYEDNGNSVVFADTAGYSRYVVRPHGSTDPAESLTILAMDDEDFARRWDQFAPGVPIAGYEVEVTRPED